MSISLKTEGKRGKTREWRWWRVMENSLSSREREKEREGEQDKLGES